ncbi:hypothetical protein L596_020581 [Steinernema carpocapsae]|uniref:Uncharacterized protein n=1 Tax=Steinernema carpocapsae TaxID=34508 RepID=A0A4U5MTY6_STECR|nr:hypothetical protein L596_020581 [Steinernema carpocapsae]
MGILLRKSDRRPRTASQFSRCRLLKKSLAGPSNSYGRYVHKNGFSFGGFLGGGAGAGTGAGGKIDDASLGGTLQGVGSGVGTGAGAAVINIDESKIPDIAAALKVPVDVVTKCLVAKRKLDLAALNLATGFGIEALKTAIGGVGALIGLGANLFGAGMNTFGNAIKGLGGFGAGLSERLGGGTGFGGTGGAGMTGGATGGATGDSTGSVGSGINGISTGVGGTTESAGSGINGDVATIADIDESKIPDIAAALKVPVDVVLKCLVAKGKLDLAALQLATGISVGALKAGISGIGALIGMEANLFGAGVNLFENAIKGGLGGFGSLAGGLGGGLSGGLKSGFEGSEGAGIVGGPTGGTTGDLTESLGGATGDLTESAGSGISAISPSMGGATGDFKGACGGFTGATGGLTEGLSGGAGAAIGSVVDIDESKIPSIAAALKVPVDVVTKCLVAKGKLDLAALNLATGLGMGALKTAIGGVGALIGLGANLFGAGINTFGNAIKGLGGFGAGLSERLGGGTGFGGTGGAGMTGGATGGATGDSTGSVGSGINGISTGVGGTTESAGSGINGDVATIADIDESKIPDIAAALKVPVDVVIKCLVAKGKLDLAALKLATGISVGALKAGISGIGALLGLGANLFKTGLNIFGNAAHTMGQLIALPVGIGAAQISQALKIPESVVESSMKGGSLDVESLSASTGKAPSDILKGLFQLTGGAGFQFGPFSASFGAGAGSNVGSLGSNLGAGIGSGLDAGIGGTLGGAGSAVTGLTESAGGTLGGTLKGLGGTSSQPIAVGAGGRRYVHYYFL